MILDYLLRLPASALWKVGSGLHRKLYQSGVLPQQKLPKPVISVGNWTMGGTGKTPFTDWLMGIALQRNKKIVVLSRGYGRQSTNSEKIEEVLTSSKAKAVGDEPLLLKMHHPEVAIFVGRSRYHAGLEALKKYQPDFFILDDGFQHHQLARKANIVLIDATQGPLKHKVFPLGWGRESEECLQYADWIIHTKTNFIDADILKLRREWLEGLVKDPKKILSAEYRLAGYFDFQNKKLEAKKEDKVLALAGIAHADVFFQGVRQDFSVLEEIPYSDHQEYTESMATELLAKIQTQGAKALVVTEKDWVKLKEFPQLVPYLWTVKRKIFIQDSEALHAFCDQMFI